MNFYSEASVSDDGTSSLCELRKNARGIRENRMGHFTVTVTNNTHGAGGKAQLTILADNEHNCRDYAYPENGAATYAWLGAQKRGN